jgi:UDP-2,3-diacylglucosamine pyrophosphatase LpxH
MLRRFDGFRLGSFRIVNKVLLELDEGKQAWIFHGDVFDVTMQHSRWLAKLGAIGYNTLILINRLVNFVSEKIFRKGKLSLSKRIKDSVKSAVKFINNFEQTAADIGIANGYEYVICGHIHQPEIRRISNHEGSILYLNSGDWIENLTALEYNAGHWRLHQFNKAETPVDEEPEEDEDTSRLFNNMLEEFKLLKTE